MGKSSTQSARAATPAGGILPPADRLGRYRLLGEIASGGMASVHLAVAEGAGGFGKLVALKTIHPHLASAEGYVEMFMDEARIAARIDHPNVCAVLDFGEADGRYYLAMEYLRGFSLNRLLGALMEDTSQRMHARLPHRAARIIADVCEGLHAAHELRDGRGRLLRVVHRDVSPQNLFVGFDGTSRVVDFGVAYAEQKIHHTRSGIVKGKFAYVAPEQLRGRPVDRRADVWALGVVLWEMVTLRRLFRRETEAETLLAVANEPIPRLRDVRPYCPKELDRIVARALTRDPDLRYATAREMGRDLARLSVGGERSADRVEVAEWMEELFPSACRAESPFDIDAMALEATSLASPPLPIVAQRSSGLAGGDDERETRPPSGIVSRRPPPTFLAHLPLLVVLTMAAAVGAAALLHFVG